MTPFLAANTSVAATLAICGAAFGFTLLIDWRKTVMIALVLALFEGALRKWFLAGAQEAVYLLKDVLLIGAYVRFFGSRDSQIIRRLRFPVGFLTFVIVLLCLSTLNPAVGSPILGLFGAKSYVIYIPLAFMMPLLFKDAEGFRKGISIYVLLAIPICALGIAQFMSPSSSLLNTYVTDKEEWRSAEFGSAGYARITGTFSYISGHTSFVLFFGALVIGLLLDERFKRRWLYAGVVLPLLALNAFLSGSRAEVFGMAFTFIGVLLLSVLMKVGDKKYLALGVTILTVGLLGGIFVVVDDAVEAFTERVTKTNDRISGRIVAPFVLAQEVMDEAGAFGFGVGSTQVPVRALRAVLQIPYTSKYPPVVDIESGRVLVELGLIGFLAWYLFRCAVLLQAWQTIRHNPDLELRSIITALFFCQLMHMHLSVVLNHTSNILLWASFGLTYTYATLTSKVRSPAAAPARRGRTRAPARGTGTGTATGRGRPMRPESPGRPVRPVRPGAGPSAPVRSGRSRRPI